ncbi:MAG: hypothetical protein AB7P97_21470 [Hyphomonadaceae bacterium]
MNGNLQPTKFDEQNVQLGAPGCSDLPARYENGLFVSCWELTDEQIEVILKTRTVWLGVQASGHPPVWLTVALPFRSPEDWPELLGGAEKAV